MTVAEAYTAEAASDLGGAEDLEVDMNNAVAGANVTMQNCGTGIYVENVGYYEVTESDPESLHTALSDLNGVWTDADDFGFVTNGAGILQCVVDGTDDAGLSYECGNLGTVSSVYGAWYVVYSHELGRNTCLEQGDDVGSGSWDCLMLFNYCSTGNSPIPYFSNPSVYYEGIQLLGTTNDDCSEGPLANEGNNARQFALNGPNYVGSHPVTLSSLNVYNPLLSAVHCGGAAVATQSADQRTFAADQNYSGGTAWDANGYNYTVDVSGVTNPAPQTAYQDQRYGDMSYTFSNYLPGTNYLVRLHCMECCWSAAGQREFNVFINGREVLTNFDIYATAGAQDRAVIKEIMTTASTNGKIEIGFTNVVDNASVSAIEILQGGVYVPLNLAATAVDNQVWLNWDPVAGATSYNVKRATVGGGPYTTIASVASPSYTDVGTTAGAAYYYVVSALNGANESFNSLEAGATTATNTVDTWVGGSGNNFGTAGNWNYSTGPGPVASGDALAFGSVGSAAPNNNETGFNFSSLTFNGGAQAYTIGGNGFTLGSTTPAGPVLFNNSTNPQTINNNITLANAAQTIVVVNGNLMLDGCLNAANTLTLAGPGMLTLGGPDFLTAGDLNLNEGTLAVTNGGAVSLGSASSLLVGAASYQCGALYQSAGTTITVTNTALGGFQIGGTSLASGYFNLSGGTVNVGGEMDPAGSGGGLGTFGQFDMSGGTVNLPNSTSTYFLPNRGASGESSVVNISGGTIQISGGGTPANNGINGYSVSWSAGYQTNVTTISGAGQLLTPSLAVKLNQGSGYSASGNAANDTTLNLNGGLLQTLGFQNGVASANPLVNINFNGGALEAGTAANPAFITNLAGVYIYNGGATINDNGQAVTIGQSLLAPVGNGVNAIAVATGGTGYITPPQVFINGGGGSNATAYATISGGAVMGIIVTSPGGGYSSAPTVTLAGGGCMTAATLATVTTAPNVSGGLTKLGAGSLTLNSPNTYTGATFVRRGKLALNGSGTLASSSIVVSNGTTFDVSGTTSTFTVANGQSLLSSGTITGAVTTVSGAGIYANTGIGYGTNSFKNALTFVSGALCYLDLGTIHNGSNDLIAVTGALTLNNTTIHVSAPATGVNLDTNMDYVLMTAGSLSGAPSAIPVWDVVPANATNYYAVIEGGSVALHYSTTGLTPPSASGSASPAIVTRNQGVLLSVTQTNGSTVVTNVTVNASAISGPSSLPLVAAGGNVFTNTVSVGASAIPGLAILTAVLTDANNLSGQTSIPLTIAATNQVWNGGSAVDNNWTSNPNWTSGASPGYSGDSVTFAGTTRLSPVVNTNYSVNGITFSNNAGSFNIGTANDSTLTLSGGGVTNDSASPQTLNVPIVLSAPQTFNAVAGYLSLGRAVTNGGYLVTLSGSSNMVVSGAVSGAGGLVKSGAGAAILSANNTYTGPTTVSGGTLTVVGTVANTNITTVGGAAGNSVVVDGGTLSQQVLLVGNVAGAVGAVYQTNGTVSAATATTFDNSSIGNVAGGFGYYDALGGTFTSDGIAVGGENNNGSGFSGTGGNGIMDIRGGTVNDTGWLVMARGATNETGVLNVYGGTLDYAGGGLANCWGSGQTAVVNVLGGTVSNTAAVGLNLNISGNVTNTGILNLDGGTAEGYSVSGTAGQVNFNGGTLKASAANPAFLTGLGSVNVYSGGATINDNGNTIGVSTALLAPTGNGINGIASFTPGAGYVAPPIVTVARGTGDTTGVGATAVAQVDVSTGNPTSGQVTNVLITCPGVNYTATPTFVLSGGGAVMPATITGRAPTTNSSGGFTKTGSGTLTLGGYSTYAGTTTVSSGTLQLADPVLHLTFDNVSGSTVVNEGTGGSALNGTLEGTATIVSGGRFGKCLNIPSGAANAAYVLINNPVVAMTGANAWTIAMWIKTTTAGGVYAYQGSGGWSSGNMTFYLNEGSDAGYGTKAGGVSYAQGWEEGSTVINNGNWHFLVMTCNGSAKAMYVDGNVDSIASSWAANTGAGSELWIGGSADTTDEDVGLGGTIDEVYVYNRALSQSEIKSLYARNSTGTPVLPAATTVNVASGATLDVGGLSQTIGYLTGSGNVILGDDAAASGNFTVSNANNVTFGGNISDAGFCSLTKAGAGTLTLEGTNTYPGTNVIQSGVLLMNGLSASSATIVSNNAVLGGGGAVGGTVTVNSGGTLSPGPSIGLVGTLTLSNSPSLNGVTLMKINRNGGSFLNDQIKLSSAAAITFGGTLTVTNVGAVLQTGDTFQLFGSTGYNGAFAVTNLPPLNGGLAWSNSLTVNGSIAVFSAVSLAPANILCSVSGTNLTLTWPPDHTGWRLLMQTNNLNAGVSPNTNDWTAVANSSSTNSVTVPLNPSLPDEFYRLVYP